MKKHLIDSGPLIALFDKDDKYHEPIKEYLKTYNGILYTTWPVITEVLHMLDFNARVQVDFLKWIKLGGVDVVQLDQDIMSRIIELSEKYSDVPMNFADTTLIVTSEIIEIEKIISIDSDFYIYKNIRDKYLKNEFLVE